MSAVPIVITILFSISAWAITHSVGRLIEQPIIKIKELVEIGNGHQHITLHLTNITQNVNFTDVKLKLLGDTPRNRFSRPKTTIDGPGWGGLTHLSEIEDSIDIILPNFHPGWKLKITTTMTGHGSHRLQLESASTATVLQKSNLKTFLIEHELCITTTLALLTIASIALWAYREAARNDARRRRT